MNAGASPGASTRSDIAPGPTPSSLNAPAASVFAVTALGRSGPRPRIETSLDATGIARTMAASRGFPSGPLTLPVMTLTALAGAGLVARAGAAADLGSPAWTAKETQSPIAAAEGTNLMRGTSRFGRQPLIRASVGLAGAPGQDYG